MEASMPADKPTADTAAEKTTPPPARHPLQKPRKRSEGIVQPRPGDVREQKVLDEETGEGRTIRVRYLKVRKGQDAQPSA